jgi:hypothetical protein
MNRPRNTDRRNHSPVADAVTAYVSDNPGATVRAVAGALFPSHANGGIPAAQGVLSWLMKRGLVVRQSFGPNIAARYNVRATRAAHAVTRVNGVSLVRAPWDVAS